MDRQKFRKLLLILALLLFPLTLFYFSPVLIIEAGLEGIINGSFIVFSLLFISSIFFGRVFCAYACPGGGLQECTLAVSDKQPKQGRKNHIKYWIWVVWIVAVIFSYIYGAPILKIDFLYGQVVRGISVATVFHYTIYYIFVFIILLSSLFGGKRAFCHYFCWMAPFMVVGIKLRNLLRLPGLYIAITDYKCISCKKCNSACPMCIDIESVVKKSEESGGIYSLECIQCGTCADICPKKMLKYCMGRTNKSSKQVVRLSPPT